jgi:hypothetical protein
MKSQRRFAPTSGEFAPESPASFIGISTLFLQKQYFTFVFNNLIVSVETDS